MVDPDAHGAVAGFATLVVANAVTKIDALAIIALTLDAPVQDARTARPWIPLAEHAWVEIEIPKFGEPPPLAIDVCSALGEDHARLEALGLAARLEPVTGWRVRPDFPV